MVSTYFGDSVYDCERQAHVESAVVSTKQSLAAGMCFSFINRFKYPLSAYAIIIIVLTS